MQQPPNECQRRPSRTHRILFRLSPKQALIRKSFLKDGEAESYQNVHVVYIPGKKAIMTIYEGDDSSMDGWENRMEVKESIVLSDYANKV